MAGKEELTNFNHLFWKKTRKNLTDGHIWFSVVNRPVRSRFTRVQRLTCCISLLFCSMMASIAFYGADDGLKTEVQSQIYISLLPFLDHLVYQPKSLIQFCFVCHVSLALALVSSLASYVQTSPSHRFKHTNVILGTHLYLCLS